MLEIKDKKHVSLMIGSLEKIYKHATIYGKLNAKDLYFLNIIYNVLNTSCIELTNKQIRALLSKYYDIAFKSDQVCPPNIYKFYTISSGPKFIQAEVEDCNSYPANNSIFYWQENSLTTNAASIAPLADDTGFLTDKLSDSYSNFEIGKTISYTNIGRICFLALESNTTSYEIKDVMNTIVNDSFTIQRIPAINATLFVSKNVYSHGNINFKIKKLT